MQIWNHYSKVAYNPSCFKYGSQSNFIFLAYWSCCTWPDQHILTPKANIKIKLFWNS